MTAILAKEEIERRLVDAIVELGPERDAIRREATLEELDLDAPDLGELGQVVEEEWGVTLEADDVENLATVGDAFDLVFAHILDRVLG
jgi:acyl carrier protein